ncbi:hypothetical protein CVM73_02295 [Bradyrhizobium forestalis]|uniref:Uncharacterized protein n=1 Tax=Bradyrhizobium forestalis TaxID=1419263 RepID=A0A2M8RF26_9BRAD|nr:hypothetical protein [Bradyrhizobium forestalis]PJG56420.1 hypothetical protein CVM73_02295 [Bradyrhizobium forestalis]
MSEVPFWVEAYATGRDEIWEEDPNYKGFLAALEELKGETDRGVALVATSFLDKVLTDTLAAFMLENDSSKRILLGFNAPFGTFSTRITGCHALGLISDAEVGQCDIFTEGQE